MARRLRLSSVRTFAILSAACVIVLAGMHGARAVVAPIALGLTIAVAIAPFIEWLVRHGVPRPLALLGAGLLGLGAAAALGAILVGTAQELLARVPTYQEHLAHTRSELANWFGAHAMGDAAATLRDGEVDSGALMTHLAEYVSGLTDGLWTVAISVLVGGFALVEVRSMARKVRQALARNAPVDLAPYEKARAEIMGYVRVKAFTSFLRGAFVFGLCTALRVDMAAFWGALAFVFGFLPMVGGFFALVPATIVALLDRGWVVGGVVFVGIGVMELVLGNIVEPRMAGSAMNISPLVLLISMLVWGFVLGPIGALLCGPLTVAVRIAISQVPQLATLAGLLGHKSPDEVGEEHPGRHHRRPLPG